MILCTSKLVGSFMCKALQRPTQVDVRHFVKSSIFCVRSQFDVVSKWLSLFKIKTLKHWMTLCTSSLVESFICYALHRAKTLNELPFVLQNLTFLCIALSLSCVVASLAQFLNNTEWIWKWMYNWTSFKTPISTVQLNLFSL